MSPQDSNIELAIRIVPVGYTEISEIADLTPRVQDAVGQTEGVSDVARGTVEAPEGTKAGPGIDFGSFITSIMPGAVKDVLGAVVAILTGSGSPPVEIEIVRPDKQVRIKFNPKTITAEEMGNLVQQLTSGSAEPA